MRAHELYLYNRVEIKSETRKNQIIKAINSLNLEKTNGSDKSKNNTLKSSRFIFLEKSFTGLFFASTQLLLVLSVIIALNLLF